MITDILDFSHQSTIKKSIVYLPNGKIVFFLYYLLNIVFNPLFYNEINNVVNHDVYGAIELPLIYLELIVGIVCLEISKYLNFLRRAILKIVPRKFMERKYHMAEFETTQKNKKEYQNCATNHSLLNPKKCDIKLKLNMTT